MLSVLGTYLPRGLRRIEHTLYPILEDLVNLFLAVSSYKECCCRDGDANGPSTANVTHQLEVGAGKYFHLSPLGIDEDLRTGGGEPG